MVEEIIHVSCKNIHAVQKRGKEDSKNTLILPHKDNSYFLCVCTHINAHTFTQAPVYIFTKMKSYFFSLQQYIMNSSLF